MISPRKKQHCTRSIRQDFIYPQIKTSINYNKLICIKPTVNQSVLELKGFLKNSKPRALVFQKDLNFILHFQKRSPESQTQTDT